MSVSCCSSEDSSSMPKRVKMNVPLVLSFSDADKLGTIKPHDNALVVMLRIGGCDVKRVMIDQGSHIRCPRENRILSLQDNVSILLLR